MAVAGTEIRRIAVIDDDPSEADVMSELIREADYEPMIIRGPRFKRVKDLIAKVRESGADAAICDHRLEPRGYAMFKGAEAVAALIEESIPSLLITQYIIDADVSIRLWRHRIPVLLRRDDIDPDRIIQGLNECMQEIRHEHLSSRRPWRTLIQVDETNEESGEVVVDVHIPSWNPHQAVRFPAELIPQPLRENLAPGACLFAMVNIGAERAEDLYFFGFESAPEPEPEDVLLG
jgi:CheY-like chemotaxis protein